MQDIKVLKDSSLSLHSYAIGEIKTLVHAPYSHPGWSSVSDMDEDLVLLMQIIAMIQQVIRKVE